MGGSFFQDQKVPYWISISGSFTCQIADYELHSGKSLLEPHKKILFLTFARNAVARIRQTYLQQISCEQNLSIDDKVKKKSDFERRIVLNTFAGFFWWLVESYGRYSRNGSRLKSWFLGSERIGGEYIPAGYIGYTFDELESTAFDSLRIPAIHALISDIFPLIIIDEQQDVHERLNEIILLLGEGSRLVLLRGPGQCIYQSMKKFDSNSLLLKIKETLKPIEFEIFPLSQDKQRCCPAINNFVKCYDNKVIPTWYKPHLMLCKVPRKNKNDNPNSIEIRSGLLLREIRKELEKLHPNQKNRSIAILTSTNDEVIKIYESFQKGSDSYKLNPIRASMVFNEVILLHYGRLIFELISIHWISKHKNNVDNNLVATCLSSLHCEFKNKKHLDARDLSNTTEILLEVLKNQKTPNTNKSIKQKLQKDLINTNEILWGKDNIKSKFKYVPLLSKSSHHILDLLSTKFVNSISHLIDRTGKIEIKEAKKSFESSIQKNILFEKLGFADSVQIMTIHKSKGREFDGVILVLEDNHMGLWELNKNLEGEQEDLYRVAITRARDIFALITFDDIFPRARPSIQRLIQ